MSNQTLDRIAEFLQATGFAIESCTLPNNTFLPGIQIVRGMIRYDPNQLRWPGDLLHEAGHIATTPAAKRAQLNDALEDHQDQVYTSEAEATAWAFAATVHLGLDPAILFHDGGYHGHSAGLIFSFQMGIYPGAFGLAKAGLCHVGQAPNPNDPTPQKSYPHMLRWMRD